MKVKEKRRRKKMMTRKELNYNGECNSNAFSYVVSCVLCVSIYFLMLHL